MLSFGIAPAVLVYLWALVHMPPQLHKLAWLGGFFLVACAAIRLARFNVQLHQQDKKYFQGLPTPGAALLLATAVLFHEHSDIEPWPWLWLFVSIFLAWLMVSRVRFFSGKDVDLKQRRTSGLLVVMIVVVGLLTVDPYRVPFVIMLLYCLHGPVLSLWQNRRLAQYRLERRAKRAKKAGVEDEDQQE